MTAESPTGDVLDDLAERLSAGAHSLDLLARKAIGANRDRLLGKVEGMKVALSYVREEIRRER